MISPKTETNIERRRRRNYSNHDKKNHNDLEKELIVNTTTLDKCTDIKTASIKVKIIFKNIQDLFIFPLISELFDL